MLFYRQALSTVAIFALAACHSAADIMPGDPEDHRPWNGIAYNEAIRFIGTEPFWNGTVAGDTMTYSTPERPAAQEVKVSRFAGRGGVSFSGRLASGDFTMMVTPAPCSDGMSDARYPFAVTLKIGEETQRGCGWTARQPRRNEEN